MILKKQLKIAQLNSETKQEIDLLDASVFTASSNPFVYRMKYCFYFIVLLQSCNPVNLNSNEPSRKVSYFKDFDYLKMNGIGILQDTAKQSYVQVEQVFDDSTFLFLEIHTHNRITSNQGTEARKKRYYKRDSIWSTVFNTSQEPYVLYQVVDSYKQFIDVRHQKWVEYRLNADFASQKMKLLHLFIQDSTGTRQYSMFSDSALLYPLNYETVEQIKKFATYSRLL